MHNPDAINQFPTLEIEHAYSDPKTMHKIR